MQKNNYSVSKQGFAWLFAVMMLLTSISAYSQGTRVEVPRNKYTAAQDAQLGREASAEVERQMPLLPENGEVDDYVERVGARLVAAIPPRFRHREFNYEFDVVNARDINAFALPGGPLYVNRGMIEAARNEGELAGVLAHEVSHTALRHGTAQATRAQSWKFQLPAIGGAILGAIIGGNVGSVLAQGAQFGVSTYFLKFSREYERQADLLGAQIMASAGYDPRDLANVFRTIERQSGSGPEWLSSHPNPGDRYNGIMQEARRLRINRSSATQDTAAFNRIQDELRRMPRAPTMEEIARSSGRYSPGERRYPAESRIEKRVELPSARYRTHSGGNLFRINVPENWREFAERDSVTFAPPGAFGTYQGQSVFTHGVVAGVVNAQSRNLRQATDRYINALLQNNQYLDTQGGYRRARIDGQAALQMMLVGRSPATGQVEQAQVYTTLLRNGDLFYLITVTPRAEARNYNRAFRDALRSIVLNA